MIATKYVEDDAASNALWYDFKPKRSLSMDLFAARSKYMTYFPPALLPEQEPDALLFPQGADRRPPPRRAQRPRARLPLRRRL